MTDADDADAAAQYIQSWLHRRHSYAVAASRLLALRDTCVAAKMLLDQFHGLGALEDSQQVVLGESFLKFIGLFMAALPTSPRLDMKATALRRKVASAFLIARYRSEVLGERDSSSELKEKAKACYFAAALLCRYVVKAISAAVSQHNSKTLIQQLVFVLEFYFKHFDAWKQVDSARMLQELEDTFSQSYLTLLIARAEGSSGQEANHILHAVEMQVQKISEVLLRIMGKTKGKSRIEELCAAVESSPTLQAEDAQADSTELRRTLTPRLEQTVPAGGGVVAGPAEQEQELQKLLSQLAGLAGVENERLAHEISIDKNYRLPSKGTSEEPSTSSGMATTPPALASFLRKKLLGVMGDKLLNSLRTSNITDLQHVQEGMVIPIKLNAEDCYSAKVIAIGLSEDQELLWMDVEFLADNQKVEKLPASLVKLSSDPPNGSVLVQALLELSKSIAQLTPKRYDLALAKLLQIIQPDMLQHMLAHRAISSPATELLPMLLALHREVLLLQAEYRAEGAEKWLAQFQDAFYRNHSNGDELYSYAVRKSVALQPAAASASTDSSFRSFEEVIPLLPVFLERTMECVDEIQRDMANYYISMLVPVLQQHGAAFLSRRFQQRLSQGQVSLDSTVAFLAQVLQPQSALNSAMQELVEAEACPSSMQGDVTASLPQLLEVAFAGQGLRPLLACALIKLLQSPVRLDSAQAWHQQLLPATFSFDAQRLASIRDIVDKICLESSLVISSRQLLQRYRVVAKEHEEIELQHRLDALLSSPNADGTEAVNRVTIANELLKYVQFAIYRSQQPSNQTAASYDQKELEDRVEKALQEVLADNNMIWQLFQKRVYKLLLRALLGKAYAHKLASFSLQSTAQERNLATAMGLAKQVFELNMKVHGPLYASIASMMVSGGGANTAP